jgi:hypothetical protein
MGGYGFGRGGLLMKFGGVTSASTDPSLAKGKRPNFNVQQSHVTLFRRDAFAAVAVIHKKLRKFRIWPAAANRVARSDNRFSLGTTDTCPVSEQR